MTTHKFMEFDKKEATNTSLEKSVVGEKYNIPFAMAHELGMKHQHQRDIVLLKKLMEIVELQNHELKFLNLCCECRATFKVDDTLAQVETMLKELGE
jgi:hypothetical protein